MVSKILNTRISGVAFDGRQELISQLSGHEPCRLVPEPTNVYDPNAIAVMVAAKPGVVWHIGYVPKEIAAQIADYLEGESLMVKIAEITGGFELADGEGHAALGVRIRIELPNFEHETGDRHPGQWEE